MRLSRRCSCLSGLAMSPEKLRSFCRNRPTSEQYFCHATLDTAMSLLAKKGSQSENPAHPGGESNIVNHIDTLTVAPWGRQLAVQNTEPPKLTTGKVTTVFI